MANGEKKPNDATIQIRLPEAMKAEWTERAKGSTANSRAEYIRQMVTAGQKKFDAVPERDATNAELRRQRNELRDEIEAKDKRIRRLEERASGGAKARIRDAIQGGALEWHEVRSVVQESMTERITRYLNELEADGEIGVYRVEADDAVQDLPPALRFTREGEGTWVRFEPDTTVFYDPKSERQIVPPYPENPTEHEGITIDDAHPDAEKGGNREN